MSKYRYLIVALSCIAIIINYLDRTAISYAILPLKETFNLNDADFGVIASAFGIGYLIMTLLGGILVDTFGARRIWTWAAFLWSLACFLIAFATGFITLFIYRLILGIAEGPNFPALTRMNADWIPVNERGRTLAFGLAAVPFASVFGAPFISYLIDDFGWRAMFIILGLFGMVWSIIWYVAYKDHPRDSKFVSEEEKNYIETHLSAQIKTKTTWRFMLFHPPILANNIAFFSFGYLVFFAITWLPGFLQQSYHLSLTHTGWFLTIPWLFATIFLLIGGTLSDYIWRRTSSVRKARSHIIWVSQLLSALSFIPILFHPDLFIVLICLSLGLGFGMMPNAPFYAINTDLAHDRAATSLGLMDAGFALAGILAPFLTGFLTMITGNFTAAFGLLIFFTIMAVISVYFFQRPE